jgi:YD repeat-containing protein
MANLVGSDHVQGTLTISSDHYANTTGNEIRWDLDTASASPYLIHRRQTHNAFGEIASETDGRNYTTSLYYNTEGRLIQKVAPQVTVTSEAGADSLANPTDYYYYDKSGRQVAQRDANGNLTTQTLLAGSGYGGSQALVTAEYRPGSVTTRGYDNWGDERTVTDGLGAVTTKLYDANHNLVEVDHPVRTAGNSIGTQLKDYYAYDALGQRIKHWNSQLGAGVVETTDYDAMGRVTRTVSMGGQWTNYIHTYYSVESGLIATPGLGNFGGWQKITSTSAGGTHYENKDLFGRTTAIYDFGAHHSLYNYDNAGHLVQQTNNAGQNVAFTYYENGYVKSITDNALQMQSTFEYDNNGNRTRETYNGIGGNPVYYQNAAITYDAMNRMTRFLDPKADIQYKYDAVGNRRNIRSLYQDGVGGGLQEQNYWYKYDGQNRFVTTMGTLSGGVILRGSQGVDITYDAAGNRATATYGHDNHTESYSYTADGYLENASTNGVILSRRTNDALGRVIQYTEYAANGVTAVLSRWSSFDNDNRATADTTDTVAGSVTTTVAQTYDYRAWNGAAYAGADQGVVTHTYAHQTQSGTSAQLNTHTNYYYVWWDEAKQSSIIENASNPANPNSGQWAPGIASLSYDVNGHVVQVVDQNAPGGARITNYRNDAYGQVMVREQQQNGVLGARQLYCYFNGMRIGDVGNNGPSPNLVDYAQQLAARGQARDTGLFRYGRPVASADFDQNYQPINAGYPGTAASSYTVRTGDTLATIAQALWGDSAMWYLIAEANGLASSSQLIAGQRLIIPNKVTNVHNNTGTFRVYNPGEAIGDTLPTLPNEPAPPPARKKGGCGGIGAILLAVVAIAVTAWVAPHLIPAITNTIAGPTAVTAAAASGTAIGGTAAFAGGVVGGAIAGAAGSIVSQGLGLATGLQDRFNWGAVGLAAIGAGVSGGLAGTGAFGGVGSKIVGSALRGAAGNAVSQGLGIATGLQDRFDWGGVAAAGVGAGISSRITLPGTGGRIVSGMAGGLAASAAESLVTGRDFGDTIAANLPGIIGNTVGGIVAEGIAGNGKPGAGGSTTGAGDGTSARPTPGAGGGQVGGSGSGDDAQPGDIVVTARRGGGYNAVAAAMAQLITQTNAGAKGGGDAGGVAAVAAIDRGNHPYPVDPEDMSGNTAWQLRAKKAAYLDTVANSGQTFTDNELNVKAFDDLIARADAREAPGVTAADAEVNEILRAGLAPIDIGVGGYNIAVGSGGLRDYLAVASLVPVGKVLGAVGAAARSEIKGFASYSALKRYLGSPGAGNQWHHIVEKTPGNIKAFGAEVIHSTENVVAIPASTHIGKGSISAYYSGKDFFTNGQTVRQWLATQSLQAQRQFGLDTLKRFGQ